MKSSIELKIAYFSILEENILSLHVTMKDLTLMQIQQGKCHLSKPIDNQCLREVLILALLSLDLREDVSSITVYHDDV